MGKKKKLKKTESEPNELSPEELRKFKGLEKLTDAEAEKVATTLQQFSIVTYKTFEIENNGKDEPP